MRLFVLYGKKSSPSARALAESLKKSSGLTVISGTVKSKFLRKYKFPFVVNVGNSKTYKFDKSTTVINPPKVIAVSANKKLARIRFKAKGLSAPDLWLNVKDIPGCEYPVIGRTTYHMKANGFWYCRNKSEAVKARYEGATHFMKFIDNTREFRAHVFSTVAKPSCDEDYIIAKLAEKRSDGKVSGTIIKNHENGYNFLQPDKRFPSVLNKVRSIAKEVVCKFGLHYGGVDIMYSKDTKKVYLLEINTTPCLTDEHSSTLQVYTDKILSIVNSENLSK